MQLRANGSLHRLRLVASAASVIVTSFYVIADRLGLSERVLDVPTLLALIGWNLTCLGLYQWAKPAQKGDSMHGQTLVEYGLILAMIAVVVIIALLAFGPIVSGIFNDVGNTLNSVP